MRDKPVRKGKKPDGQQSASLMWACEVAAAQVRASALERDREAEEATKNRCSNFIGTIGTGGQGPWQGREGGRTQARTDNGPLPLSGSSLHTLFAAPLGGYHQHMGGTEVKD